MLWDVKFYRTKFLSSRNLGNSLEVQWLGLCALTAGYQVWSLTGEIRAHKSHGTAKKERKKERNLYLDLQRHEPNNSNIWQHVVTHGTKTHHSIRDHFLCRCSKAWSHLWNLSNSSADTTLDLIILTPNQNCQPAEEELRFSPRKPI